MLLLQLLAATLVALAGIGVATLFFLNKPERADAVAARFSGLHRLLLGKYYVDELYDATVVRVFWATARGLFAGGFRAGDRVLNTFAYHFTPAGSMLEQGAAAIGCTVVPGGVGQTTPIFCRSCPKE